MSGQETRTPEAQLGLLDATMIGMGAMIGAGIFVLTGLAADIAGPAAILVFGAVFSTLTALNAVVIASSRVAFSIGREGQFLPRFGQLHHRYGTPFLAILASAVVMLGSVVLPTESAGNMSSLFFLLSFVVNGAVIRLRRRRPNIRRPYEIPYYPIPPILGVILNLLLTGVLTWYLLGSRSASARIERRMDRPRWPRVPRARSETGGRWLVRIRRDHRH